MVFLTVLRSRHSRPVCSGGNDILFPSFKEFKDSVLSGGFDIFNIPVEQLTGSDTTGASNSTASLLSLLPSEWTIVQATS